MLSLVPAMIAMTLVIVVLVVYANRPQHGDAYALAENMARYHNSIYEQIQTAAVTDPIAWTDGAVELWPLQKIARWRSEVIVDLDNGQKLLITYPSLSDFPLGHPRFAARDFMAIPDALARNGYSTAAFGLWSDSVGVGGFDFTDSVLPSTTSTPPGEILRDVFPNYLPVLTTAITEPVSP
jgi:hypothetical protein